MNNYYTVVTSTALTEDATDELENILKSRYQNVKYSPDLTSDVNILVINKNDPFKNWLKSKKFMYVVAYRPDIRVIDFESLNNTNSNIQINQLPKLGTFENLQISLCRLEDDLLEKTNKLIKSNGGKVIFHLTKETDLVISMIADGKRYEAALNWGIPIVSPDWCYDSVERGLPLNTKYYRLTKNMIGVIKKLNFENEEDKIGVETTVKTYSLGRRDEACDWEKLKDWRLNERSRKLEEYIKNKINKEEELKKKGIESNNDTSTTLFDETYDENDDSILIEKKRDLSNMQRSNNEDDDKIVKIKKTNKYDGLWNSIIHKEKNTNTKSIHTASFRNNNNNNQRSNRLILDGLTFKIIGYDDKERKKLIKVINKFGGKVINNNENIKPNFTVVSFKYNKLIKGDNLITELAIERFIYNEKVDSGNYLWCKPFIMKTDLSIEEFRRKFLKTNFKDKIKIAISGFDGTDLSQMERLLNIKLSKWVEFKQSFSQDCEILVIGISGQSTSGLQRKQKLARQWGIPILLIDVFFSKVLELSESS